MTSWVIVNKKTGRKIFETYSEETAKEVREHHKDTLEAVPKEIWLCEQEAKGTIDRFLSRKEATN